ncbi:Branched-chain amino acid transport system permease protein OS=Streptomyces albaduncus OX=68172 GN=FHS32_003493 PE=3 SV=1 [Streptomyces griseoloalbus]
MNELPQQLVNGLLLGSMYGLVAIGYTMVYGIVQLINFAHGEIFMVGAFGAITVHLYILPDGTSMWIALPLMLIGAMIASVLVAIGAERFAYRPLRGAPRLAPLITAIGLSLALQQAIWAFYPEAKSKLAFPQIEGGPFSIGGATIQTGDIFLIVAAPISMAFLAYFVMKTRTGRGMQATAQDPDTAKLMGVNTDRIIVIAFALGAVFAAVGGVASGLKYGQIDFKMGFILGLKALRSF